MALGGGGGGGLDVEERDWSGEWPTIKKGYKGQEAQYSQFIARDPLLRQLYGQAGEEIGRRGALSEAEEGRVRQATLATAGQMGMGWTPGTLGTELLNREQYRQQREDRARQFATGTLGAGVSAFGGLTNPILNYISQLYSGNLQAQTAAAQAQAQQAAGNKAGMGQAGGAAIGAIGTVAAAAL